ncbi:MAG: triose-phosphate isomerase [Patescibacteria group bacterium]|nr:triose-phosphate isomerase [Patescibacteria group bacterium]MDD5121399.1 triose-phosphate isomerase [Patescibacteria group bacterium]MDD5221875.1 triose-phosphate isomerase [Patescibacteria group bacterium]MDD5395682.1 triose-phosphate isomerase [Patescibacteria group bacterium]
MKQPIIIANWKMNISSKETDFLLADILKELKKNKSIKNFDLVFCPDLISLISAQNIIKKNKIGGLNIALGAQNCFWEERGSYTGETSPLFLKQIGCQYVLVGHSERREYLGETSEMINKKIKIALNNDLTPIVCVGETFTERQSGARDYKIMEQVGQALDGVKLKVHQKLILAYEPVWVSGSGQTILADEAEYVNRVIKQKMIDLYPLPIVRNNINFVYGGNINHNNIKKFLEQDTIDGILVGAASLNPTEFIRLCRIIS